MCLKIKSMLGLAVLSFSALAANFTVEGYGQGSSLQIAIQDATANGHADCIGQGGSILRTETTSTTYQFGIYWATVDVWCRS